MTAPTSPKRGGVVARLRDHEQDDELAAFAARDAQPDEDDLAALAPDEDARTRRRSRPMRDLAAEIFAFAKLPRLSWGFAEIDRLAPFPVGSLVVVLGATGRCKTSFVLRCGHHHARHLGPVLIVSAELAGAIAAARIVSAALSISWSSVLAGDADQVEVVRALDIPNMRIVDEISVDILNVIEAELVAFATEAPGKPALVIVDYVQLLPGSNPDIRLRVGENVTALRKLVAKHGAGAMVVSKAGRAAAKGLRAGESMGADATEAGAETNAIEHEATVLLALGAMRPANADNPDGPSVVDVSIAKARFGIADKIVPLLVDPASGRFDAHGAAVSASDRRAETKAKGDSAKIDTLVRAVRDLVSKSDRPLSKAEITDRTTGNNSDIAAAIKRMTTSEPPELVAVVGEGAKRRGGHAPLWTPERASAAGLTVVPREVEAP